MRKKKAAPARQKAISFKPKTEKDKRREKSKTVKKAASSRKGVIEKSPIAKPIYSTVGAVGGDRLNSHWNSSEARLIQKTFSGKNRLPAGFKSSDPEFVSKIFALKGIQFGNWVTQEDRLNYLVSASASMYDMKQVMGLSYAAIGFFGRVTLAFGARGHGSAAAHFEPSTFAINLTRYPRKVHTLTGTVKLDKKNKLDWLVNMGGVGSLSHEWGHALDCYLGLKFASFDRNKTDKYLSGGRLTSYKINTKKLQKGSVPYAMAMILNTLNVDPKTGKKSAWRLKIEKFIKDWPMYGDYYVRRTEIFARAFESYLAQQFIKKGIYNDFITKPKYKHIVYPTNNQLQQIKPYFDQIVSYLRSQNS